MRTKIRPPCFVRVKGTEEVLDLRSVSHANTQMKRSGWKGLVAVVQNEKGSGLVEYNKLEKVTFEQAREYHARKKRRTTDIGPSDSPRKTD